MYLSLLSPLVDIRARGNNCGHREKYDPASLSNILAVLSRPKTDENYFCLKCE